MELRYVVSRPRLEQLSLVRVQFEPVSGHPATNIDDALLEPSCCRGDVFTAGSNAGTTACHRQTSEE